MTAIGVTAMSVALTAAVISNAYYQKKQFYPSVVYITKSNPSMAVIYIQAFILLILIGKLMRKIFFGQLRAAEFEHLVERSWYAITETCLAFTVFRDDFSPKFVALFTVLLFLKSFHWLAEDRVDFMERSPIIGWLFHVRVVGLLSLLGALDLHFLSLAYYSTVTKGASVQLVFGFEFAILLTMAANTTIKYCLHAADLRSETPWDGKAVLLLYCELAIGFLKVLLYVAFIVIFVRIYTLPLFAFRPMYYTMRNFKKAFNDVILSRRAIRNMNTLYPDATLQELTDVDNVCIICREEMTANAKKLPCNHIFHTACLRSWFQRQQTCPTCRLDILRPTPVAAQNNAGAAAAARMAAAAGAGGNAAPQPGTNAGVTPGADNQIPTVSPPGFMNNHPFQHMMPPGGVGFPPFPFPMVGFVPPPVAPVNLAQLTDDELREMEGNERRHLEARIKCLRNVQLMLDASVALMQNYQMVVSRCPPPAPAQPQQAQTAQPESQTTETAAAGPSTSSSVIQNEIKSETTPNEPKPSTSKSQIQDVSPQSLDKSKDTSDTLSTNANGGILTETDELRRRRLRRFETQMTE